MRKNICAARRMKVGALCGVVALGAGMFVGCEEQNAEKANPALQGTTNSALQSSINPALQKFAEEALRDGTAQYGAADGCAIVMDVKTGRRFIIAEKVSW